MVVATVTRAMCGTSFVHFLESYFYNPVDNTVRRQYCVRPVDHGALDRTVHGEALVDGPRHVDGCPRQPHGGAVAEVGVADQVRAGGR